MIAGQNLHEAEVTVTFKMGFASKLGMFFLYLLQHIYIIYPTAPLSLFPLIYSYAH
jgi:hypothetical protein